MQIFQSLEGNIKNNFINKGLNIRNSLLREYFKLSYMHITVKFNI